MANIWRPGQFGTLSFDDISMSFDSIIASFDDDVNANFTDYSKVANPTFTDIPVSDGKVDNPSYTSVSSPTQPTYSDLKGST